jgi:hypothetical protein
MRQNARRGMFSENSNAAWTQWWLGVSVGTWKSMKTRLGQSTSLIEIRPPESLLTLNGWNIPFVNNVKYLDVIFDKKITQRPHIEMIEAKAFRTFIRVYSLFKSERLSSNIKLTLHKALIRSVMTYACPSCEFVAGTHVIKLQRLKNKVCRTIDNFPRCTPVCKIHMAFHLPYVYDYMTKCRQQVGHSKSWQWKCSLYWTRWNLT